MGPVRDARDTHWLFWLLNERERRRQPGAKSKWLIEPLASLWTTIHWARALRFEIEQEFGEESDEQFTQCLERYRSSKVPQAQRPHVTDAYEALFHGLTCAATVSTMEQEPLRPWSLASTIVCWYYAHYNCLRAMLFGRGSEVPENHSRTAARLSDIRKQLPHPLNMAGGYVGGERYDLRLESHPECEPFEQYIGQRRFQETREHARGVLLQYLKGTADAEVEARKAELLRDHHELRRLPAEKKHFRGPRAREIRNEALRKNLREVNFLHCTYRYRCKANYRDAIYISYGRMSLGERCDGGEAFSHDLAASARFVFRAALAYLVVAAGPRNARAFVDDVRRNLRCQEGVSPHERFWETLTV